MISVPNPLVNDKFSIVQLNIFVVENVDDLIILALIHFEVSLHQCISLI